MCAAISLPAEGIGDMTVAARQRGVTLIELIVAIVIISVGLAGVMSAFSVSVKNSADPMLAKQSMAIAEALMEEVQLAPFTYCDPDDPVAETAASVAACAMPEVAMTPEAGDIRPFDNVNDYNGLHLATITDVAGVPVPFLGGYQADVSVAPVALNGISLTSGDALRITVSVIAPNGDAFVLDGYRTRFAPNAVP